MNSVVYYPHLVPNLNWLKIASLCWDKVYVLHPKDTISFPEDIEIADKALGRVLHRVDTQQIGMDPDIISTFGRWLEKKGKEVNVNNVISSDEDLQFFRFFPGKMPPELYEKLSKQNLIIYEGDERVTGRESFYSVGGESKDPIVDIDVAQERKEGEGMLAFVKRMKTEGHLRKVHSNIYLPSEIALHYLSLCASKASKVKKADLFGTNNDFFETTTMNATSMLTGQISQSIVQAYLPDKMENISVEVISSIRQELSNKRILFQLEIQNLTKKLQELSSEDELGVLKKRIEAIAKERINETQKSYRDNKIKVVLKSIGISLTPPALANYIASALSIGIIEPVGIGLSIALFTGNTIFEYNKVKSDYNNNAWSYITEVARKV